MIHCYTSDHPSRYVAPCCHHPLVSALRMAKIDALYPRFGNNRHLKASLNHVHAKMFLVVFHSLLRFPRSSCEKSRQRADCECFTHVTDIGVLVVYWYQWFGEFAVRGPFALLCSFVMYVSILGYNYNDVNAIFYRYICICIYTCIHLTRVCKCDCKGRIYMKKCEICPQTGVLWGFMDGGMSHWPAPCC